MAYTIRWRDTGKQIRLNSAEAIVEAVKEFYSLDQCGPCMNHHYIAWAKERTIKNCEYCKREL
jgi:hypothetical protein